jgi:hypothetical protein
MTERQWLAESNPHTLLTFLLWQGRISERKRRLYACACCRPFLRLLDDPRPARALEAAERRADGRADEADLRRVREELRQARQQQLPLTPGAGAIRLAELAASDTSYHVAPAEAVRLAHRLWDGGAPLPGSAGQCELLRDVAGNPFRPARVERAWLLWRSRLTGMMAEAIYDARRFDDLPVLGDALEEAGCDEPGLLGHLRGPGPHARGCWVLDLLLGKG